MLGQMVMVFPGVPEQVAVNVPLVGDVPPGPMLILPKFILVTAKVQTCACATPAKMVIATHIAARIFIGMSVAR